MEEQIFFVTGDQIRLPALVQLSSVRSQVANRVTWHSHKGYELLFLLEGATAYEFPDKKTAELHGGTFLVVPPNVIHRGLHDVRSPSTILGMVLNTDRAGRWKGTSFTSEDLERMRGALEKGGRLVHPFSASLRWLVRRLREETSHFAAHPESTESPAIIRALLCTVLAEAMRQMLRPTSQPETFVAAAVAYLRKNLNDTVRMADLVRHVGFSRARMFDLFKAQTGLTPNHYLQRLRIEKAQEELRRTNKSVTEIAHATGFSSAQYFSTVFIRYTGKSPSNYRKAYQDFRFVKAR
jgi:AraC-like DNA-binding protein